MDHRTFDRLTHLFAVSESRRTAWRALLAATLFGVTTRSAAAKPCNKGKHLCGDTCCPGKCFVNDCGGHELCCTGKDRIICGNTCCKSVDERGTPIPDPCRQPCVAPEQILCPSGVAGSYRRR
jgi:hypothetical protein